MSSVEKMFDVCYSSSAWRPMKWTLHEDACWQSHKIRRLRLMSLAKQLLWCCLSAECGGIRFPEWGCSLIAGQPISRRNEAARCNLANWRLPITANWRCLWPTSCRPQVVASAACKVASGKLVKFATANNSKQSQLKPWSKTITTLTNRNSPI